MIIKRKGIDMKNNVKSFLWLLLLQQTMVYCPVKKKDESSLKKYAPVGLGIAGLGGLWTLQNVGATATAAANGTVQTIGSSSWNDWVKSGAWALYTAGGNAIIGSKEALKLGKEIAYNNPYLSIPAAAILAAYSTGLNNSAWNYFSPNVSMANEKNAEANKFTMIFTLPPIIDAKENSKQTKVILESTGSDKYTLKVIVIDSESNTEEEQGGSANTLRRVITESKEGWDKSLAEKTLAAILNKDFKNKSNANLKIDVHFKIKPTTSASLKYYTGGYADTKLVDKIQFVSRTLKPLDLKLKNINLPNEESMDNKTAWNTTAKLTYLTRIKDMLKEDPLSRLNAVPEDIRRLLTTASNKKQFVLQSSILTTPIEADSLSNLKDRFIEWANKQEDAEVLNNAIFIAGINYDIKSEYDPEASNEMQVVYNFSSEPIKDSTKLIKECTTLMNSQGINAKQIQDLINVIDKKTNNNTDANTIRTFFSQNLNGLDDLSNNEQNQKIYGFLFDIYIQPLLEDSTFSEELQNDNKEYEDEGYSESSY